MYCILPEYILNIRGIMSLRLLLLCKEICIILSLGLLHPPTHVQECCMILSDWASSGVPVIMSDYPDTRKSLLIVLSIYKVNK
jgi:hypothetical protein